MVSPKQLRTTIESVLLGPAPPSPGQRIELMHAIRSSLPSLRSLLSYPGPRASDRAQVQSKEVRLPDSPPISLDDTDVQIAIKLSDDLNLHETECVRLLISANQEWILFGREPLEIYRLAAGLWYTERRDILTSLYTLLRAVVLDQGLEADLVADIQKHLEDLFTSGLRQRLLTLIKELNREEPAGIGGPSAERYVLDSRGALVERRAVVCRERLTLGHCLVLSVLVVRMSSRDVKDIYYALKDFAVDADDCDPVLKLQVTLSLMFSLVIAFTSDALSTVPDKSPVLSHDAAFRHEFQELVMAIGNDPIIEGFCDCVRLGWTVHLMLTQDRSRSSAATSSSSSHDIANIFSCLELICANNVFHFLRARVLQSAAYQNDDEDMVYMYNAYLHKLMMCFLSHPLARDKVKEMKEKAMSSLSPYLMAVDDDSRDVTGVSSQELAHINYQPFISLLELVTEIYQKEPELAYGNEDLWTFVIFSGEDHTNIHTLVAFLRMLSTLASSEEGASKVYELLQSKTFRSIGWNTLFDCLSIYEEKFKQSIQNAAAMLPDFEEGDAKALVAYLNVLQKVVENGNPIERKNWFPDIESLFKLLGYENVPPYLKGALRNAIASFIQVSPVVKDTIWSYLEQYDLPVVVGPPTGSNMQQMPVPVYDMRFELNEVEARQERYPSTISFINLLNALIAKENDLGDRGRRFLGIFRFIYDHVFGPFPQRAYADPCEKWELVVASLQHFKMILTMYAINDEDADIAVDLSQPPSMTHAAPLEMQLPILELLKDFMSGRTIFRNIMNILLLGTNTIIYDRTSKIYGPVLEKAVHLSLEIVLLVFEKDLLLVDSWRPLYQPLDVILSQDHNQVVALLEYVRYDFLPQIQQCSIKIMSILSSRMVGLVQLLLKSNSAKCLVEDYAACLESHYDEYQIVENSKDDSGVLIMQLLLDNINRPAPNITHLLLKFDVDTPVDRTVLQPKYHYSCLKIILENLEKLSKPDANALLHEFGFQLLYELCMDPLTGGPTLDLLSMKKYQFFSKHVETIGISPLPKRTSSQALRISSLHQRAWLLKLLALELHVADMAESTHREACLAILSQIFCPVIGELYMGQSFPQAEQIDADRAGSVTVTKSKVLQLLEIALFRCPDAALKYSDFISKLKYELRVEDILKNPSTSERGGVYYYSERGDRLIDLAALHDKIWQMVNHLNPQMAFLGTGFDVGNLKESIQQLLRWGWKYNKNLEEQAAQLHFLAGWSQIVEVAISRRMMLLEDRSGILFDVLDATLGASVSSDCSLRMAVMLSQVSLTCMAKLRDERFVCPGGVDSDNVTCLDVISVKQLPSGACHSIMLKLMMAILRNESSELLRRRQYALLLSYFQYCRSILDPDVPAPILGLLLQEHDGEDDFDLQKVDRDQAELARTNFSLLKKEAQGILDVVTRDATQGSEAMKAISLYVLDAFVSIDQERFFLGQLQSRGFLRSCLMDISNFNCQDGWLSLGSLQKLCTLEAKLALLLRISHNYKKFGGQILISMGVLEHLKSCRILDLRMKRSLQMGDYKFGRDSAAESDKRQLILAPALRLVSSLTSLVALSELFEVKNKFVREVVDFVKGHQSVIDEILRKDVCWVNELTMEQINLVVCILSKVWPYEENDNYGFIQEIFRLMCVTFDFDGMGSNSIHLSHSVESRKKQELFVFRLCVSLISYLYFLITKKSLRLKVSNGSTEDPGLQQQPTLFLIVSLLDYVTSSLERAAEEKSLLLNKIENINELSRQEVDEIIRICKREDCITSLDNIRKRRYVALVEMCHIAGERDQLIALLLQIAEHAINILLIHFQEGKADSEDTLSPLCGKLFPTLERLEQLKEDKTGRSLKVFQRSVSTIKEMSIRKLAL
uniref:Nuclear pore complex protein Nup205 n=3 Tax=Anthurium amnicola TaxID=1678845 RepID=A0A1D1ZKM6_9ARAE